MTAIFLSHSSKDNAAADEIKKWLEAEPRNHSVFLDFDPEGGIKGGSDWEQTLYERLRTCRVVIPLLTRDWLTSKWCFAEVVHARSSGKTIVPLKVAECDALDFFPATQQIDLTRNTEEGYQRLESALREVFSWDESRPPYPGLLAFQERDAAIFFGRKPEISAAVEKLESMRRRSSVGNRFTLVLGASGSGKSSLVRAGVVPRLRNRDGWLPVTAFQPREEPLSELAAAIAQTYELLQRPRDYGEIHDKLHKAGAKVPPDGEALSGIARDLAIKAQRGDATMLLVVDQAEELFGESGGKQADRFLRLLRAALERSKCRLMVMSTMRSEFLGAFQTHPFLLDPAYPEAFAYQKITVDPLPVDRFTEIIRGPADLVSLAIDDALVERMVKDTGTRDALPLLAYTLRRLWDSEACRAGSRFQLRDYEQLGGLEGSIRKAADEALGLRDLQTNQIEALRAAFIPAMVRVGADGARVRRRAYRDELPPGAEKPVQRFIDTRLLVTNRDRGGRETVEVAHEALLRVWPQLEAWLEEDQDKLRLLESVRAAAEEWQLEGRTADFFLHRGERLAEALALVREPRFALRPGSLEARYLEGCDAAQRKQEEAEREERERRIRDAERIAEEQKKTAQRTRIGLFVAVVLFVVAVVVGWIARKNAAEAEKARDLAETRRKHVVARQLATGAADAFEKGRLEKSALIAIESLRFKQTEEGLEALKMALKPLLRPPEQIVRVLGGDTLGVFSIDPTGRWLALTSTSRGERRGFRREKVLVRDLKQQINDLTIDRGEIDRGARIQTLVVSPDGQWVAGGGRDIGLVWDGRSGKVIKRLWHGEPADPESAKPLNALTRSLVQVNKDLQGILAFSPDGSELYVVTGDDAVHVYETSTWTERQPFKHQDGAVLAVTTDLNGQYLVTGSESGLALWSAKTRKLLASDDRRWVNPSGLSVSPDNRFISARWRGSGTAGVVIWRFPAVEEGRVAEIELYAQWPHDPGSGGFEQALFSPSGRYLVVRQRYRDLELLEVPEANGKESNQNARVRGSAWRRRSVNMFKGAKYICVTADRFAVGVRAKVGFWTDRNNEGEARFIAYPTGLAGVGLSSDGRWLAGLSKKGVFSLYEGETLSPVPPLADPVREFIFSPDAKWLAVRGETSLRVLEVGSWRDAVPPQATVGGEGRTLLFTKASRLVVLTPTLALLINPQKAEVLPSFEHGLDISSIRLSPDGEWFWAKQNSQVNRAGKILRPEKIRIWATKTSREAARGESRTDEVSAWPDVTPSHLPAVGKWHENAWWRASAGRRGGIPGILAYPLQLEDIVDNACGRLSRNLSKKEWKENILDDSYQETCTNWRLLHQESPP